MKRLLSNGWRRTVEHVRAWWREVKAEVDTWRLNRHANRPLRGVESSTRALAKDDAPWGEWPVGLFRFPGFREPDVRVYRRGSDLVMEAEERWSDSGTRYGMPYAVSSYQYVYRSAPAPADTNLDRLRRDFRARLTGRRAPRARRIPVRAH